MAAFSMDDLSRKIRDMLERSLKSFVAEIPYKMGIPVVQINRCINQISEALQAELKEPLAETFAVNLCRADVSDIMLDTESEIYKILERQGIAEAKILERQFEATAEATSKNIIGQQEIELENQSESKRIMLEGVARQQMLSQQSDFLAAHQLNLQADVAKTAAQSLGNLGGGMGGGDGMNPAGMMTGMMLGGAVGGHMAGMMGGMMHGLGQPPIAGQPGMGAPGYGQQQPAYPPAPPALPVEQYFMAENGTQSGPYSPGQLRQMIATRQVTGATYIWKQGMTAWAAASTLPELADAFGCVPPPPPAPPAM